MKKILLLLLVIILYNYGCKEKTTNPPDEQKPIGYQEDIPWQSLANSPWPMNHHDPQNTGRSQYSISNNGIIKWKIEIPTKTKKTDTYLSNAIGDDSSIYFIAFYDTSQTSCFLFKLKQNSELKWKYRVSNEIKGTSPPIVRKDGSIIFGSWDKNLYCLNREGNVVWKLYFPNTAILGRMNISKDGTIYAFTQDGVFHFISSNGNIIKSINLDQGGGGSRWSSIVITPDESTIYVRGNYLFALDREGNIKWKIHKSTSPVTPVVDNAGNVYCFFEKSDTMINGFYSITPEGKIRYRIDNIYEVYSDPAIDKNGNLILGYMPNKLISIDYYGRINWSKEFDISHASSIITDKEGKIYFTDDYYYFYCLNNNGEIIWKTLLDGWCYESPSINEEGLIFLGTVGEKRYFYCIK